LFYITSQNLWLHVATYHRPEATLARETKITVSNLILVYNGTSVCVAVSTGKFKAV